MCLMGLSGVGGSGLGCVREGSYLSVPPDQLQNQPVRMGRGGNQRAGGAAVSPLHIHDMGSLRRPILDML